MDGTAMCLSFDSLLVSSSEAFACFLIASLLWLSAGKWAHLPASTYGPWHGISNNVVCATSKGSAQPAQTRSLIRAFARRLNILWVSSFWLNIMWNFYVQKRLHMLVWVYTCQNATLLEITCRGSNINYLKTNVIQSIKFYTVKWGWVIVCREGS